MKLFEEIKRENCDEEIKGGHSANKIIIFILPKLYL